MFEGDMRVLFLAWCLRATTCPHRRRVRAALRESVSGRVAQGSDGEGHQRSDPSQVSGRRHSLPHQPLRRFHRRRSHGTLQECIKCINFQNVSQPESKFVLVIKNYGNNA